MSDNWDVVIVGAGIVGAACALECAAAGCSTAVVEGKGVGSGATAAGMGHIVVMDDSPAQMALTHYSQTLVAGARRVAFLPMWNTRQCGTLWVASDEEEMRGGSAQERGLRFRRHSHGDTGRPIAGGSRAAFAAATGGRAAGSVGCRALPALRGGISARRSATAGRAALFGEMHFRHGQEMVRLDDGSDCTQRAL